MKRSPLVTPIIKGRVRVRQSNPLKHRGFEGYDTWYNTRLGHVFRWVDNQWEQIDRDSPAYREIIDKAAKQVSVMRAADGTLNR